MGTRKAIFRSVIAYNTKLSSQYNLNARIKQVPDEETNSMLSFVKDTANK